MTACGASETKFELTVGREEVLVDKSARDVHELWHAVSFLLPNLARGVTSVGKVYQDNWQNKKKLT